MLIPDPGSWFFFHPGSQSQIQGSKKHQIPDPDPQHWFHIDLSLSLVCNKFVMRIWIPFFTLMWNRMLTWYRYRTTQTPFCSILQYLECLKVRKKRDSVCSVVSVCFFSCTGTSFRLRTRIQVNSPPPASVGDPWHFGTDPDPGIPISDLRIQIRPRILLFSSVTFKTPTRKLYFKSFFAYYLPVLLEGTFTSFFKDKSHKEVTKQ